MAVRAIRLFGDSCLRRRAREADVNDPATRVMLDEMWAMLDAGGGVGLAAPQVGRGLRVVVVRDPSRPAAQQRLDLVNPVIRRTTGPQVDFEEGCLSFPGLYTAVQRPQGIEVSYQTPDSGHEVLHLHDNDLVARIVQHEVDHLDGVLFIDHLSVMDRWLLAPRLLLIALRRLLGRGPGRGERDVREERRR